MFDQLSQDECNVGGADNDEGLPKIRSVRGINGYTQTVQR